MHLSQNQHSEATISAENRFHWIMQHSMFPTAREQFLPYRVVIPNVTGLLYFLSQYLELKVSKMLLRYSEQRHWCVMNLGCQNRDSRRLDSVYWTCPNLGGWRIFCFLTHGPYQKYPIKIHQRFHTIEKNKTCLRGHAPPFRTHWLTWIAHNQPLEVSYIITSGSCNALAGEVDASKPDTSI